MKGIIALKCEVYAARGYVRSVRLDAICLLKLLCLDSSELSLVLTSDESIRELNRIYRGKDRPTDVLSFPQNEDSFTNSAERVQQWEEFSRPLGDIVISVDTALRQAERLHVAAASRLRTLLIHGLLHLVGYDHEKSRAEARRMFARERELAAALVKMSQAPAHTPGGVED